MFSSWARRSLEPASGPGHHISGLFGHGGGEPAASLLDHLSRFLPREFLQTAGEDESHSGKTAVKYFLLTGYVDPGGLQTVHQILRLGAVHPLTDVGGGDGRTSSMAVSSSSVAWARA